MTLVPWKPAPLADHTLQSPGILTVSGRRVLDAADICVQVTGEQKSEPWAGPPRWGAVFLTPPPSLSSTPAFPDRVTLHRGPPGRPQRLRPDVSGCSAELPTHCGTSGIGASLTSRRNQRGRNQREFSGLSSVGSHMERPPKGPGRWLCHQAT